MDLSGIIFVVLALSWALYLIPKALKNHDEIARTRSIDRSSKTARVLARREPVNRRDTRLVVTPAGPGAPREPGPTQKAASSASRLAAARAAARRRRHILVFLLLVDLGLGGAAAYGYLRWWAVPISIGLTLAYLFICRRQARRNTRAARSRQVVPAAASAAASVGVPRGTIEGHGEAAADAVAVRDTNDGSLWDPLPMTLPTYVDKPRAGRTVRTIDLTEPNTWSSGRSEADTKLVKEATATREEAAKSADEQRAVGS